MGPSKEELDNYWKNSRQYFDELAKTYKESDPEYYNKFIAPYYSNPFRSVSSSSSGKGKSAIVIVFVAVFLLLIVGGAAALLIFISNDATKNKERIPVSDTTTISHRYDTTITNIEELDSDYFKGLKYLSQKDYDKAEEHLRKVGKNDKNYKDAQQVLKSIQFLKQSDQNKRSKPIQPIR